jgi:hypothetical protein
VLLVVGVAVVVVGSWLGMAAWRARLVREIGLLEYPGAVVEHRVVGWKGAMVTYRLPERGPKGDDVLGFYRTALRRQGWAQVHLRYANRWLHRGADQGGEVWDWWRHPLAGLYCNVSIRNVESVGEGAGRHGVVGEGMRVTVAVLPASVGRRVGSSRSTKGR